MYLLHVFSGLITEEARNQRSGARVLAATSTTAAARRRIFQHRSQIELEPLSGFKQVLLVEKHTLGMTVNKEIVTSIATSQRVSLVPCKLYHSKTSPAKGTNARAASDETGESPARNMLKTPNINTAVAEDR